MTQTDDISIYSKADSLGIINERKLKLEKFNQPLTNRSIAKLLSYAVQTIHTEVKDCNDPPDSNKRKTG